jgi:hypothetical protein
MESVAVWIADTDADRGLAVLAGKKLRVETEPGGPTTNFSTVSTISEKDRYLLNPDDIGRISELAL